MGRWGGLHAGVEPGNLRSVRRVFDGHERLFFEAFRGSVADPTAQAWPLGLWVHRGLGLLVGDPRWLLVLPSLAGAVAVVLVAALTSRHFGRRAGAWAGVLAAVLPEHVAWSTSAVPVVLATTLMLWSFWVRSDWGAAVLLGLAAALRPELALWGLCRGWAGLAGLLVGVAHLVGIGAPPTGSFGAAWSINMLLVDFVAPWVVLLAAAFAPRGARRVQLGIAAGFAGMALFTDLGPRHLLLPGLAVCGLAGAAVARRPALVGVAVLGLVLASAQDLRAHWHVRDPAPVLDNATMEGVVDGCVEVSDEPPIPGQPVPSHLSAPAGACWVWALAPEHTEWSSRGLRARAHRMGRAYGWTPVAVDAPGGGRPWRLWVVLEPRLPWRGATVPPVRSPP